MANLVGSIAVSLGLDAAEYVQGLSKAEYQALKATQSMARSFESLGTSIKNIAGLVGVGLGVREMVAWGESILSNAEALQNLKQETGSSIESISKLENAGIMAGKSFEDVRSIVDKFAAGLGHADDGTNKVREALNALGVTARDPVEAITQAAVKLNQYADGANKAAFARDLFSRNGVQFIGVLAQMANNSDLVATKTEEQVRAAVELLEAYRRLEIQSHQLRDAFLVYIVPALTNIVGAMNDAISVSGSLAQALQLLAQLNPFGSAADNLEYLNSEITKTKQNIDSIKSGDSLWVKLLGSGAQDTTHLENELKKLEGARELIYSMQLRSVGGPPTNALPPGYRGQAPTPPSSAGRDQADAIARRALEAQLKIDEEKIKQADKTQHELESIYAAYYASDLIGIREYYAEVKRADEEATTAKKAALDDEIAALTAFANNKARKPEDRIRAEGQITDAIIKRAGIEQETAVKSVLGTFAANQEAKRFLHTVDELAVSLAQLRGETVNAANLGFAAQYQDQLDKARANLNSPDANVAAGARATIDLIRSMGQQVDIQARLTKATDDYGLTLQEVAIAQQLIDNQVAAGTLGELDALRAKSEATKSFIGLLQQQLEVARAVAAESGQRKDIIRVQELQAQLGGLQAQGDLVAKKFQDIFETSFADAFASAIDGTKSLSAAFKDMERSIVQSISRIAAQKIAESIFGGDSSTAAGGLFGWLGNLFAPSVGSSLGASTLAIGMGFASGTNFAPGGPALVGERGPEIINVPRGSQIIPNSELTSRRAAKSNVTNINVNVLPGASRQSAMQAAAAAAREARTAAIRNG